MDDLGEAGRAVECDEDSAEGHGQVARGTELGRCEEDGATSGDVSGCTEGLL